MTTKVLALPDVLGNLGRFRLMPGNRFDTIGVAPLIDGIGSGALVADKVSIATTSAPTSMNAASRSAHVAPNLLTSNETLGSVHDRCARRCRCGNHASSRRRNLGTRTNLVGGEELFGPRIACSVEQARAAVDVAQALSAPREYGDRGRNQWHRRRTHEPITRGAEERLGAFNAVMSPA